MFNSNVLLSQLAHCIGTESYHQHWTQRLLYTDGIKTLAEGAECYWLIDAIASHQSFLQHNHPQTYDFQTWTLSVSPSRMGAIVCALDDLATAIRQQILFTDFPLPGVTLYCFKGVLLLPFEY
jgi:hypothetical protein